MNGKAAKLRTQAGLSHLSFDEQCRNCEKVTIANSTHLLYDLQVSCSWIWFECVCFFLGVFGQESIKDSVMNLTSYSWIRDRVRRGEVKIHGCYYNLSDCSLEKWKLSSDKNNKGFYVSDREIWSWVNVEHSPVIIFRCISLYIWNVVLHKWRKKFLLLYLVNKPDN